MQDESYYPLGLLDSSDVGVQSTPDGQDILIKQSDIGPSLACLLGFGKADVVRRQGVYYWRFTHNRQVDDLMVELIDLLISIRYAHPATIRTYHAQAAQYVACCRQQGVSPSTATENDIIAYRKYLVETGYKPTTIALKLAVVRRLYEAIQWRGLRTDNPASGVKAPRDRTARDEQKVSLAMLCAIRPPPERGPAEPDWTLLPEGWGTPA